MRPHEPLTAHEPERDVARIALGVHRARAHLASVDVARSASTVTATFFGTDTRRSV